jgi:hypothetical protein
MPSSLSSRRFPFIFGPTGESDRESAPSIPTVPANFFLDKIVTFDIKILVPVQKFVQFTPLGFARSIMVRNERRIRRIR